MCLGWGTNLPWVPGSHRAAGSSMWLQQCFPREQDQHRERSDLLLLLGFGASQSENPAPCSCTCCWCRERNTHCRAGILSPTHPSGTSHSQIPAPGASRESGPAPTEPHSPIQSSPSHSRDKLLALPRHNPQPLTGGGRGRFFPLKHLQDTVLVGFTKKQG